MKNIKWIIVVLVAVCSLSFISSSFAAGEVFHECTVIWAGSASDGNVYVVLQCSDFPGDLGSSFPDNTIMLTSAVTGGADPALVGNRVLSAALSAIANNRKVSAHCGTVSWSTLGGFYLISTD